MKLCLGSGMTVAGRKDQRPLNEVFRAFGTDDLETTVRNHMGIITLDKKKSEIFAYPIRGYSLDSVKRSFKEISEAKFTLERSYTGFIVKIQPSHRNDLRNSGHAKDSDWYAASKDIMGTLQQHKAFCCVTVPVKSFGNEQAHAVAEVIGIEASRNSSFWKILQSKLTSGGKGNKAFRSVPSQKCFVLGPSSDQHKQLASSFKSSVNRLSKDLKFADLGMLQPGFERYQVRRFASILAEAKKCCPSTLFYIDEVGLTGGDSVEPDFAISVYEWLSRLMRTSRIMSIRIGFATLGPNKSTKGIQQKLCTQALQMRSTETDTTDVAPKGCSWRTCCNVPQERPCEDPEG